MTRQPYSEWVAYVTTGEFLGFLIPSITGALTVSLQFEQGWQTFSMVIAGLGEGAVLGSFQSLVLGRHIKNFKRGKWILATMAGAGTAWVIGMIPSTLGERMQAVPLYLLIPAMLLFGTCLLLTIGGAQYLVLKSYVADARKWIWINAAAWLVGLAVVFAFMFAAPEGIVPTIVFSALGGLGMAASMAAVTGRYAAKAMQYKRL